MTTSGRSYEYDVICDECGFKKKSYELAKRWDGLMVCKDTCWEPRNILDFYRTRNDAHVLPFTRPDGPSNPSTLYVPGNALNTVPRQNASGSTIGTQIVPNTFPLTVEIMINMRNFIPGLPNNFFRYAGGGLIIRTAFTSHGQIAFYDTTNAQGYLASGSSGFFSNPASATWVRMSAVLANSSGWLLYYNYEDSSGVHQTIIESLTPTRPAGLAFTLPITFGCSIVANEPFDGLMDDFRVWNTARTAGQILTDWNSVKLPTTPGLISNWRFDEGWSGGLPATTFYDNINSNNSVQAAGATLLPRSMAQSLTN